jgi:hypothetical protein
MFTDVCTFKVLYSPVCRGCCIAPLFFSSFHNPSLPFHREWKKIKTVCRFVSAVNAVIPAPYSVAVHAGGYQRTKIVAAVRALQASASPSYCRYRCKKTGPFCFWYMQIPTFPSLASFHLYPPCRLCIARLRRPILSYQQIQYRTGEELPS